MPKIYVQHPAVNGKKLLEVFKMIPSIDELAESHHPQQIKMTLLPKSIYSEAHQVLHGISEYELKKGRNASMRMWTEDDVDLGTWGILDITDRDVTLCRE